jgi:hypothetical protein
MDILVAIWAAPLGVVVFVTQYTAAAQHLSNPDTNKGQGRVYILYDHIHFEIIYTDGGLYIPSRA